MHVHVHIRIHIINKYIYVRKIGLHQMKNVCTSKDIIIKLKDESGDGVMNKA